MSNATLFIIIIGFLQQKWVYDLPACLPNRAGKHPSAQNLSLVRADSIHWLQVPTDSGMVHAAIAMPKGAGPFPAVVLLHGTHGFGREYVNMARRLADKGVVGVAACWFAGRRGAGVRFITPLDFSDSPPFVNAPDAEDRFRLARHSIDALVRRVGTLSQVRAGHMVLFGHSLGGGAALDYVLTHPGNVQGVITNSSGYPPEVTKRVAAAIQTPVLLLHGTADSPAQGGSALTTINMARQFEAAMQTAHKPIDVWYYEGSDHNNIFIDSKQFEDTANRIVHFIRTHVAK